MNWWQSNGGDVNIASGQQLTNGVNCEPKVLTGKNGQRRPLCSEKKRTASDKKKGKNGSKNVQILIIPESGSDEQVVVTNEKFRQWNKVLLYPKTVKTFVVTLEEISHHFSKTDLTYIGDPHDIQLLQGRLQTHVAINGGKTIENILLGWQVFYKVSSHIDADEVGNMFIQQKQPEAIYGMLFSNTNYYMQYPAAALRAVCFENLETSSAMDAQNLESLLKVINLSGFATTMSESLWSVVCRYLLSKVDRVREIVLLLFLHLLKDEEYLKIVALPKIFTSLDWYCTAKYDLLSIVLVKYDYNSLSQHPLLKRFMSPDMFVNGLLLSLKDSAISSISAKLLKVFVKQTNGLINKFIVRLIKLGSLSDVLNLLLHFAQHLDLPNIYEALNLHQLSSQVLQDGMGFEFLRTQHFQNLVLCRRLFHESFAKHFDCDAIDDFIKLHCSQHPDLTVRQQVLEIWKRNVETNTRNFGQSINYIPEFISQNANVKDSALLAFLLQQIPDLIEHFIANVPVLVNGKKLSVNQLRLVDIILKLESLYLDGTYEQESEIAIQLVIFLEFLKYLKDSSFRSTFIYSHLTYPKDTTAALRMQVVVELLVVSDNEVIREMAMLTQKLLYLMDGGLDEMYIQLEAVCLDTNSEICFHSQQRVRLLVSIAESKSDYLPRLQNFVRTVAYNLMNDFNQLKDPLVLSKSVKYLHIALMSLHEVSSRVNKVTEELVEFFDMVKTVNDVVNAILGLVFEDGGNGKVVNGKSKNNGGSNGRSNTVDANLRAESCHVLETGMSFLVSMTCYYLKAHANLDYMLGTCRTTILVLKSVIVRCDDPAVIDQACQVLGQLIKSLTTAWTDKQYSFYDATPHDELMEFVKSKLIDPFIDDVHIDSRTACAAIACITSNDVSHEINLLNFCLSKILPSVSNCRERCHRMLLGILRKRSFDETDRHCLDGILTAVLNEPEELQSQLLDTVVEKLVHPKTALFVHLNDFVHKYPKAWQTISEKLDQSSPLILKFLAKFQCKPMGHDLECQKVVEKLTASNIGDEFIVYQIEARQQQLADLPGYIDQQITKLFTSTDNGQRRAIISVLHDNLRLYKDQGKFVLWSDEDLIFSPFRKTFETPSTKFLDWPLDLRSSLLDVLVYLGFGMDDKIMFEVVFSTNSSDSTTLQRTLWIKKISKLLNDELEIKKKI